MSTTATFPGFAAIQKLAVGDGGRLFAIGMWNDDDVLMALDTDPPRLAWRKPMPNMGQPDVLGVVGTELWWADLQSPIIQRLDAETGDYLGTVSVADTNGVQAVVDMGDGSVIVHAYPSNRLERLTATGEPMKLWPPAGFFGKLFGGDRGGMAYSKPVSRPGTVTQGRVGRAHGGGLVVLTTLGGCQVGVLDGAGTLQWKANVPGIVLLGQAAEAAPNGEVFIVGSDHEGGSAAVVSPDGQVRALSTVNLDEMMHGEGDLGLMGAAVAVGPDGRFWVGSTDGIDCYGSDDALAWRYRPD